MFFLRFFGFCDMMIKTLALIKKKKKKEKEKEEEENHNKLSFSLNNRTSCLAKQ
jgi:hypothetical protein